MGRAVFQPVSSTSLSTRMVAAPTCVRKPIPKEGRPTMAVPKRRKSRSNYPKAGARSGKPPRPSWSVWPVRRVTPPKGAWAVGSRPPGSALIDFDKR
ncbi:50S ribosomal protein L32 rpmF [Mycobacterium tuberculosis T92]|nr:50S ribosomal protein L32 rpmF [Mycobacterium tuberculosis T92]